MGRSAAGKGTQAKLLIEHLGQDNVLYIEPGNSLRELVNQTNHTARLAKAAMERGERSASFLAVWAWSNLLVNNFRGDQHLVFDGAARSLIEAEALDTALDLYGINKREIVFLEVNRAVSLERLAGRGRIDDRDTTGNEKRLDWFDRDVVPVLDYYHSQPRYRFTAIAGDQSVAAIATEIARLV